MNANLRHGFLVSVLVLTMLGCGGSRAGIRLQAPPPPPPAQVQPRPGHVWVQGHWHQVNGEWQWNEGFWVPQRPGYRWVDGGWVDAGGYWRWRSGHWESLPDSLDARTPL